MCSLHIFMKFRFSRNIGTRNERYVVVCDIPSNKIPTVKNCNIAIITSSRQLATSMVVDSEEFVAERASSALVFTLAWLPWDCGRSQRCKAGQYYCRYVIMSLNTILPSMCARAPATFTSRTAVRAVAALAATAWSVRAPTR